VGIATAHVLRDERFLPFEGAGAESTWRLDLPNNYRAFDYNTISDVILHIRYTARQGVDFTKVTNALKAQFAPDGSDLALLFSLRHDFPSEWSAFFNAKDNSPFIAPIRKDYFPYFTQGKAITISGFDLYSEDVTKHHIVGDQNAWDAAAEDLKNKQAFTLTAGEDTVEPKVLTRTPDARVFLIIRYSLS
jgi:hypothetical protein